MLTRRRRSASIFGVFIALACLITVWVPAVLRSINTSRSSIVSAISNLDTSKIAYGVKSDNLVSAIPRDISHNATSSEDLEDYDIHVTWPLSNKYDKFLGRGCKLWENLQRRRNDISGSSFSEISALETNDWQLSDPASTTDARLKQLLNSIEAPLKDKNIDITTAAGNLNIEATHKPTQAKYFEVYNPKLGALIACRNYGPAWMKQNVEAYKDVKLPDLQKWSDVVFLVWAKITSMIQRINLKFVIRLNVQNEDTNDVVSEALKKVGVANGVPPAWPGYTFKPDEDGLKPFQAVLGTPNLYGVAYLLLQHAGQMGRKTIKSITVWDKSGLANQDMGWSLCIMVELTDLP